MPEQRAFAERDLSGVDYVYLWADGIHGRRPASRLTRRSAGLFFAALGAARDVVGVTGREQFGERIQEPLTARRRVRA
jgi:hypothetical protein